MSGKAQTVQPFVQPISSSDVKSASDKAAEDIRKRAARMKGRASTILTSPMGDLGSAPTSTKTLLGS